MSWVNVGAKAFDVSQNWPLFGDLDGKRRTAVLTKSAFEKIFVRTRLRAVFDDFWKANRGKSAPGIDGVGLSDFKRNLESHLDTIINATRSGYAFSPLRPFTVPKTNGKGDRLICVPTIADRIVQRLLVDHLMETPGAKRIRNDASFGFIKKRGVAAARDRAIELRNQHRWAYKSDVSSFFDRIPRDQLIETACRIFKQPSLRRILASAASCEIAAPDKAVARLIRAQGISPGVGVRQGMPISPLFSNVILEDFDRQMLRSGFNLGRSDDLTI